MRAPPSPAPTRRRVVLAGVALVLAVFAAYANSLRAPFVYDDRLAIPDNPTIRSLWPIDRVLLPQAEGGVTTSGRPVLNLSLALSYALSGDRVWGYHAMNVAIHAAGALLLFGIVRRTLRRVPLPGLVGAKATAHGFAASAKGPALAIAALWALHPLQTQAVTYIVQRAESLMGFFYLLTLYAFVRAADATEPMYQVSGDAEAGPVAAAAARSAQRWRWASLAACVLGVGTKEVMATAPLLVLLYDRTFVAGSFRAAWRARRGYYLGLAASWLVLAALLASTGGNRGGTVGLGVGVPLWAYPLTQFEAVVRYLGLGAWPQPLVFEYGTFWVKSLSEVLPYAAVVVPLLAATVVSLWRWPALGFCGAWFFAILAPTSLTPGTIQMIVEHRMYLPVAAVIAVAVVAVWRWVGRAALPAALALAVACGGLTFSRNRDYRSHLALWSDTVAKRPENPRAREGLAEANAELGRLEEAIAQRRESVRLLPEESTYHYNLGLTLADAGQHEEAIRAYRNALRLVPTEAKTHNNLAIALTHRGDLAEALTHYAEALRLKPDDPQYHYNYGVALMRMRRFDEAVTEYRIALARQPGNADAHFNLGTALVRLDRFDEGMDHYREALRLRPGEAEYAVALGGALLVANRPEEARRQFLDVLARDPASAEGRFGLANALAALKQYEAAVAEYRTLLRAAPAHANGHYKLGNALLNLGQPAAAAEAFQMAVRLMPDDAEAHQNLGAAYAQLEKWPEAEKEFVAALRLRPDYPEARRNLEQLRRLLGR